MVSAIERTRQLSVTAPEFNVNNSDNSNDSVVVLSQFPSQVSAKLLEGIIHTIGKVHVELRMDLHDLNDVKRFVKSFGTVRESPGAVVCFGTVLSETVRLILSDGIPLISVLSSIQENDPERKMGGVFLSYPLERTLKVLNVLIPSVSKVGILLSNENLQVTSPQDREVIEKLTGFKIVVKRVIKSSEMALAVAALLEETDAICLVQDPLILKPDNVRYILGKALRARIPVVGLSESYVEAGALFCLKQDYVDIGSQLGRKILNVPDLTGSHSFDEPDKAIIVINQKVLKILGKRLPRPIKEGPIVFIQ
jgi:hypothetical protein